MPTRKQRMKTEETKTGGGVSDIWSLIPKSKSTRSQDAELISVLSRVLRLFRSQRENGVENSASHSITIPREGVVAAAERVALERRLPAIFPIYVKIRENDRRGNLTEIEPEAMQNLALAMALEPRIESHSDDELAWLLYFYWKPGMGERLEAAIAERSSMLEDFLNVDDFESELHGEGISQPSQIISIIKSCRNAKH